MFEKAFIVEDTRSDAYDLIESLSIFIDKDNIVLIENIDDALNTISKAKCDNRLIVAFVDILWHGKKTGINLASSIRKKYPAIKLVAYTKTDGVTQVGEFFGVFDAFIDKISNEPHPCSLKISDINYEFLESLQGGKKFLIEMNNVDAGCGTMRPCVQPSTFDNSYFFTIIREVKTSAQFIFVDFSKFSSRDDKLQLDRFNNLRAAFEEIIRDPQLHDIDLVFLPTGDGAVVGIFTEIVGPFSLILAFNLLEKLRETNLQMELRIGIHYGPIYRLIGAHGEQQLIGTGINKAARIEAASKPGKVLVSEEYYSHFIKLSGDRFIRELTIDEVPQEYIVKEDKFWGRFVSKGQIGI